METNLYIITITPMMKTLEALTGILDKAAAHAASRQLDWHPKGFMEGALVNGRLIFDQFPFIRQVQVACDNAKGGAARLAGVEVPKFEDNEQTIDELKTRVKKTLDFMATIKPEQVIGQESRRLVLPHHDGMDISAGEYATHQLMPNFYFHITTAYSILRSNGVLLGKADYMGVVPFKKLS